jgi:hypothetical protein
MMEPAAACPRKAVGMALLQLLEGAAAAGHKPDAQVKDAENGLTPRQDRASPTALTRAPVRFCLAVLMLL